MQLSELEGVAEGAAELLRLESAVQLLEPEGVSESVVLGAAVECAELGGSVSLLPSPFFSVSGAVVHAGRHGVGVGTTGTGSGGGGPAGGRITLTNRLM